MPVIDSSTLISFARIGKLQWLKMVKGTLRTIQNVYEECVTTGITLGYPDAVIIKPLFDEKIIHVEEVGAYKQLSGVSPVDSKIISYAKKNKETLLVDDVKLGRRAKAENLNVKSTPEVLLEILRQGSITTKDYAEALQRLFEQNRLSEDLKERYNKVGGVKNGKGS